VISFDKNPDVKSGLRANPSTGTGERIKFFHTTCTELVERIY
jgi:hypothetical protein